MAQTNPASPSPQRQFFQPFGHAEQTLPFVPLLDATRIAELVEPDVDTRTSLYSIPFTLAVFLSQCLGPDGSCRAAVARVLAWLAAAGRPPGSANTGPYCKEVAARQRLPLALLQRLVRATGREPAAGPDPPELWRGHRVKVVDGTTVTMPDTPALQAAFPQQNQQKPGLGFPIARAVAVFCLATGTVLDAALGQYQGKATGENKLFRALDCIDPGDVVLGDRFYGSFWELARLAGRGAFGVVRVNARRRVDFRTGRRLGPADHVVAWAKPATAPTGMDAAEFAALPATLDVREVRFAVRRKGFRTKEVVVATTLLDAAAYPATALADLYRRRWQAELNLRSLKVLIGLDVLRCKSPAMVEKEFWARLLAYNLVRRVMVSAAAAAAVRPEELSFQGARQLLAACSSGVERASCEERARRWSALLAGVSRHRVGDRPNRVEPRAKKRRPKAYPLLRTPRNQARKALGAGKTKVG